jgi:hypothetical protein
LAGVIYTFSPAGHGVAAKWEGDRDSLGAVDAFADLLSAGCVMIDLSDPLAGKTMAAFDAKASLIVAVPWRDAARPLGEFLPCQR